MRRLRRIIFNGVTIVSLVAFVCLVGLWIASVRYRYTVRWVAASGNGYLVGTVLHGVSFSFVQDLRNFSRDWDPMPDGWSAAAERWGSVRTLLAGSFRSTGPEVH